MEKWYETEGIQLMFVLIGLGILFFMVFAGLAQCLR